MKTNFELGVAAGDSFSEIYPVINQFLLQKDFVQKSRYGDTKELVHFKLDLFHILGIGRLTGGFNRNVNVFFLLAEALWIWGGKRDVKFLEFFNSRMGEFSDDGLTFHAPYGWRMRSWGFPSEDAKVPIESYLKVGYDQVEAAVVQLAKDNETRRVTISLWNPELDLEAVSKDLPCNDFLMFKVRQGKLFMSVVNRSNDLHWGLPTNVFQFSFVGEMIARLLGVEFTVQTHYIDSLHYYLDNPIANALDSEWCERGLNGKIDLYQHATCVPIDLNFDTEDVRERISILDVQVGRILSNLYKDTAEGGIVPLSTAELQNLGIFSEYLTVVYLLLKIYVFYGQGKRDDYGREVAMDSILSLMSTYPKFRKADIVVMALNWFVARMKDKSKIPSVIDDVVGTF